MGNLQAYKVRQSGNKINSTHFMYIIHLCEWTYMHNNIWHIVIHAHTEYTEYTCTKTVMGIETVCIETSLMEWNLNG